MIAFSSFVHQKYQTKAGYSHIKEMVQINTLKCLAFSIIEFLNDSLKNTPKSDSLSMAGKHEVLRRSL